MVLKIELLDSSKHIRSKFTCTEDSLDHYILKQSSQDLKKGVASVFVLVESSEMQVLGYYTLSAYTVEIANLDNTFAKKLPRYPVLPATLLGRLAVDSSQQGKGLGELLLIDALKKSYEVTKQVASLAVITEALNEKAVSFYTKYGFERFNREPMKLYLPMKSIESLCKSFDI
ncbi:GNAT family N-acetyltransferase [Pseudanabaena sp. UWO310]|uniref:GNAT family N-acetyltransferase n=1 Tax=Pseudanabaena sp. UWO310 TaxID=2480795 RepID=UPI001160AB66|nr:GNAT family N-acetyltransferase [Pseudanabaena sp. UWO310]TYQ25372.1 GNAT family N-acetyltransferase [Pseudanabaena sp. UWO310]